MEAEFDVVARWTEEAVAELGPEYAVPAGCRGTGSPSAFAWLAEALQIGAGRASSTAAPASAGPGVAAGPLRRRPGALRADERRRGGQPPAVRAPVRRRLVADVALPLRGVRRAVEPRGAVHRARQARRCWPRRDACSRPPGGSGCWSTSARRNRCPRARRATTSRPSRSSTSCSTTPGSPSCRRQDADDLGSSPLTWQAKLDRVEALVEERHGSSEAWQHRRRPVGDHGSAHRWRTRAVGAAPRGRGVAPARPQVACPGEHESSASSDPSSGAAGRMTPCADQTSGARTCPGRLTCQHGAATASSPAYGAAGRLRAPAMPLATGSQIAAIGQQPDYARQLVRPSRPGYDGQPQPAARRPGYDQRGRSAAGGMTSPEQPYGQQPLRPAALRLRPAAGRTPVARPRAGHKRVRDRRVRPRDPAAHQRHPRRRLRGRRTYQIKRTGSGGGAWRSPACARRAVDHRHRRARRRGPATSASTTADRIAVVELPQRPELQPPAFPTPSSSASTDSTRAFNLTTGDCLPSPPLGEVKAVDTVSCDSPHKVEAYSTFSATGSTFPGVEQMKTIAQDGCLARFSDFVGTALSTLLFCRADEPQLDAARRPDGRLPRAEPDACLRHRAQQPQVGLRRRWEGLSPVGAGHLAHQRGGRGRDGTPAPEKKSFGSESRMTLPQAEPTCLEQRPGGVGQPVPLEQRPHLRGDLGVPVARQVREQVVLDLVRQVAGHDVQSSAAADVRRRRASGAGTTRRGSRRRSRLRRRSRRPRGSART